MIVPTLTFAMHILVSSLRVFEPVGHLLGYAPSRNMATKAVKDKFSTKHLTKGDPLPPFTGKLRVYNMRHCPYAQRTILALIAKKLDYEVININLMEKPEWLISKSPFGKVPSLEIKENVTIYESLVTVEYLDDVYPQRPLLPKDPVKKAYDKIIIEAYSPVPTLFYKTIKMPESITDENINAYHKALEFIQNQLQSRGTTFLDGEEPGFADYMIWPWFERILAVHDMERNLKIDPQKYKLLLEYLKNMEKDPAVQEYLIPKEKLIKFLEAYRQNPPKVNYELLMED